MEIVDGSGPSHDIAMEEDAYEAGTSNEVPPSPLSTYKYQPFGYSTFREDFQVFQTRLLMLLRAPMIVLAHLLLKLVDRE